jgi:hypothetical protein
MPANSRADARAQQLWQGASNLDSTSIWRGSIHDDHPASMLTTEQGPA